MPLQYRVHTPSANQSASIKILSTLVNSNTGLMSSIIKATRSDFTRQKQGELYFSKQLLLSRFISKMLNGVTIVLQSLI